MNDISPKALAAIVLAVVALVGLAGWFGFVSSKRSKASDLKTQIADAQTSLAVAQTAVAPPKPDKSATKEAPPVILATAFPADVRMPSILLQVQRLATASKVTLDSFAPSAEMPLAGYDAIPIDLGVTGQYGQIQRFVRQLRVQAGSVGGKAYAAGRLFAVETLGLAPGGSGLPQLSATIRIDAFVYTGQTPVDTTTTSTSDTTSGSEATPAASP